VDFLLTEAPEPAINTAGANELLVAALFDKPAAIHDEDVIAVWNGR
jgi:hypothetical protein